MSLGVRIPMEALMCPVAPAPVQSLTGAFALRQLTSQELMGCAHKLGAAPEVCNFSRQPALLMDQHAGVGVLRLQPCQPCEEVGIFAEILDLAGLV